MSRRRYRQPSNTDLNTGNHPISRQVSYHFLNFLEVKDRKFINSSSFCGEVLSITVLSLAFESAQTNGGA